MSIALTALTGDTAASNIIKTFTHLDVSPPRAVATAIDRRSTMLGKLKAWKPPMRGVLASAVLDAIGRDADVANDPAVIDALRWAQLDGHGALTDTMTRQLLEDLRTAFTQNADKITSCWGGAVEAADKKLSEAHAVLGSVDIDDTAMIIRRGGEAATAWGSATEAFETIDHAVKGWRSLYSFTRGRAPSVPDSLIVSDPSPEQYRDGPDLFNPRRPRFAWALVLAEMPLILATLDRPDATISAAKTPPDPPAVPNADRPARVAA